MEVFFFRIPTLPTAYSVLYEHFDMSLSGSLLEVFKFFDQKVISRCQHLGSGPKNARGGRGVSEGDNQVQKNKRKMYLCIVEFSLDGFARGGFLGFFAANSHIRSNHVCEVEEVK
ncbi:unnamed protein product [Rhizophagus irregularis]|nr:unnamed protein product [Rhizophagus irregularis]